MKKYVLAFTPSPALDLSGTVNRLKPNEKSYVYDEIRSPGGNAINAARILTRLKIPVVACGFLGGSTGEEIKHLLGEEGVKSSFIKIRGHSRICVTVSNKSDHKQTRLTFPGPHILKKEKQTLVRFLQNEQNVSFLIIGGSLPPGFESDDATRIVKVAESKGIKCIVDSPGPVLRKLVPYGPFFIKPNLDEFQELTGTQVKTIGAVRRAALPFLRRTPYICISSVEDGALLVTREGCFWGRVPKVEIKSSVGAGDSMVGTMTAQFFKGNMTVDDILRWGLAGAAATLEKTGTAFGSAERIYYLYTKTKVKKID